MALINAGSYGNLAAVSISGTVTKTPVKFFNTFICGDDRGQMERGRYSCPASFDDNNNKFFVLNQKEIYFIPLYFKKYWAKYEQAQTKEGKPFETCVAFGWDDKCKKIEGAKTEYIIAGWLYDIEKKNVVKHTEDMEDNDIKAGDNVLIYFRCKGIKCNCAFEYIKRVNEAAKNLEALSEDPTFEQNVINPRRFLIKAAIKKSEPIHNRRFDVFDFYPEQKLPDDFVAKILDASNNKYLTDFNKQFDKTDIVSASSNKPHNNPSDEAISAPAPKIDHVDVPEVDTTDNPADSFNIDI